MHHPYDVSREIGRILRRKADPERAERKAFAAAILILGLLSLGLTLLWTLGMRR